MKNEKRDLRGRLQVLQWETHENSLERRLRFEEMLSDLFAQLTAIPLDQVDIEIENSLRQILEFFQVDVCAMLEVLEDRASVRVTHAAYGKGVEPMPTGINLVELFPWSYGKLMRGENINITREEDYPEEALVDKQSSAAMGTKSRMAFPVAVGGRISRIITIHQRHHYQTWPEEYIPRLRMLGEILVNALERRQDRVRLDEQLRIEMLLADISGRFINLPADRIDSEIEYAQHRICELLDLDRSTLWRAREGEPGLMMLTHWRFPPGSPPPAEQMNASHLFPWTLQKILAGETIIISKMTELPQEARRDLKSYRLYDTKSTVSVPLSVGEGPIFGLLGFAVTQEERNWRETAVMAFKLVAQVFSNALARKEMEEQRKKDLQEIEELKQRFERENIYLREEVRFLVEHTNIVGQSDAMKRVMSQAEHVARTDSTVLLLGETGTGKELLARAIHNMSNRKDRTLVIVNCASLPPTLIESELFGREKGAYTGALTRMTGRFEVADGSTFFLDEIGELPLELQSKLLRVLEQGQFERLGSTRTIKVNVRIIAATNRDLGQAVKDGSFRPDLFYRLNVFPIVIPPLRERSGDIPLLVRAIVKEFQKKMGKEIESIPQKTMQALQSHAWPGNVRELRNLIEHAMILSNGKTLDIHVPRRAAQETGPTANLQDIERRHLVAVLEQTHWRLSGQGGAAEVLGLKRTTLQAKMKKLGIKRISKPMPN